MRKYKFTPYVIISMIIMGLSIFLPLLPWFFNKNGFCSVIMITAHTRDFKVSIGLATIYVLLAWISQVCAIPSLVLYLVRKQYAPIILPLISSIFLTIISVLVIITQFPHITIFPFISIVLAIANIVFVFLIKKFR